MASRMVYREIKFQDGSIMTDALLYREKCHLLLPEPFTQNVFVNISRGKERRMLIGSSSLVNMNRMKAFFSSMYNADMREASMNMKPTEHSYTFLVKKGPFREKEAYYPGLVRNLFDFSSIDSRPVIRYSVAIRSSKGWTNRKENFGVSATISFDSENAKKLFMPLISKELRKLRAETSLRVRKGRSRKVWDASLHLPFNLINLIRIPSESDLV